MAYLCKGCRMRADSLAELKDSPERFKLQVGLMSEFEGHADIHDRLKRMYTAEFGTDKLDRFLMA